MAHVVVQRLDHLGQEIVEINRANGWDVFRPEDWLNTLKVATAIALIHSEASEAMEALRTNDLGNFAEELADVLIRVLDLSSGLGINIDQAVYDKLEQNKVRGYRHGEKRV